MKRSCMQPIHTTVIPFGLLILLLSCVGCEKPAAPAPQVPEVTVAHPIQKDVNLYYDFTGTIQPIEQVEVRARVEGFLNRVAFKASDAIEPNDLLFEIEPETYEVKVLQAKAEWAAADAEEKRADADYRRVEQAAKTAAVSKQQVDLMAAQLLQAQAAVKQAEASVADAELKLTYTQVRSPIKGRVSRRLVDVGNLVGAGERTLLTTVIKMNPLYVYFNIDERLLASRLASRAEKTGDANEKPDVPFYISLPGDKGFPHEGVLNYLDNKVDTQTGTIQARGTIQNDSGVLYPGMFVRIRVPNQVAEGAVLVEEAAIGTDLAGKYLLVVGEGNVVERRTIRIHALVDGMRVVEGIATTDRYVVNGLLRARPGLPVNPKMQGDADTAAPTPQAGGDPNVQ